MRSVTLSVLLLILAAMPTAALAGTVNVLVTGPHGLYRVYLYDERSSIPVAAREGSMQYGCGCNNFAFSSMQSGHAYWAKSVRVADGMTRLGGGSVYLWWWQLSIRLPDINFPYSLATYDVRSMEQADANSTRPIQVSTGKGEAKKSTWGALKAMYR